MCKIENVELKDGEWSILEVYYPDVTTFERYKRTLESVNYHRVSCIMTFEKDHIFFEVTHDGWTSQKIYFDDEFIFWSAIKNVQD